MKMLLAAAVLAFTVGAARAEIVDPCNPFRATLVREAQAVYGVGAPVPMIAAQLRQESTCRPHVTAWDNGRGLAQFMDPTAKMIAGAYPELGPPDPYNPRWAIRAAVRLNEWNYKRVRGSNECERWAAALKAYNAGVGYVQRAQKKSPNPDQWFGLTEYITSGQSAKNFEYSRLYPRWIIFKHQPRYAEWGQPVCIKG